MRRDGGVGPGPNGRAGHEDDPGRAGDLSASDAHARDSTGPRATSGAGSRTSSVRWERLELRGFGRHQELTLELPPAMATLVRPNEWGKSTLVAGLTAVLFGLPSSEDVTAFGSGRYRGWMRVAGFGGRLTFRGADGARYRLERSFEDHGVRLVRLADAGDEVVHDGSHNPRARKRNERFEDSLAALLGVRGREAFEQVFCVGQPMVAVERLGDEVQRLLVGAGRGRVDASLEDLAAAAAARTRHTGQLGLTPGDKRKDGEIEACEARIREMRALRDAVRETADRSQEVARALEEAEAERRGRDTEAQELQREAEGRRAFLEGLHGYDERRATLREAERALRQAESLEEEASAARARVGREWPEFADADDSTEGALEALVAAERRVFAAAASRDAAASACDAARRVVEETARAEQRHARQEPEAPDAAEQPQALRSLALDARRAVEDWKAHLEREAAFEAAGRALEPFRPFLDASDADLKLLRHYDLEAAARVQALESREAAVRDARGERRRLLVPDASLPTETEAEAIRERLERPDRRGLRVALQVALSLALAVLVFLLVRGEAPDLWAAGAGLLAGLGAAALARPGPPGGRRLARFQGATRARLVALLADYDAWASRPVPSREDLRALELEVDEAHLALKRFQEAMRPYQEAFAEPGASFDAFLEAGRQRAQLRDLHAELSLRVFGVAPAAVPRLVPDQRPEPWPRLAGLARRRGGGADTVPELCAFLATLDDGAWDEVVRSAEARRDAHESWRTEAERLRQESARARTVLEERVAARTQREAELAQTQRDRAEAAAPLARLLEGAETEAEALLQRWHARDDVVEQAERPWDQLASLLAGLGVDSVEALRDRVTRRGTETLGAYQALRAINDAHPELPPPEEAQREDIAERLSSLEQRLRLARGAMQAAQERVYQLTRQRSDLQGKRVVNLAQLDEELAAVERRRREATAELDALVLAHRELGAAVRDFQGGYRRRLEERSGEYLSAFTGVAGRRVRLADDFGVSVLEPDGTTAQPAQLSQGAQDQLLMALRLAIADHMAGDAPLPLVLDDPFLNWDAQRLERMRETLERVAQTRQVLLLSHRTDFASWGVPASIRDA